MESALLFFHIYLFYTNCGQRNGALVRGKAIKTWCPLCCFTSTYFPLASFFPLSAGLSGLDPAEFPQLGRPVRPEAAAAGGGIRGGAARGPGGMSAGRGAEDRV